MADRGRSGMRRVRQQIVKNLILLARLVLGALAAILLAGTASAQGVALESGFYGGIALRDRDAGSTGWALGLVPAATLGPAVAAADESPTRHALFGGYRWRNHLAVEAALARSETYTLRPLGGGARTGVGLRLVGDETASAAWNVDVVGSYAVLRTLAFYGRIGYAQAEPSGHGVPAGEPRASRDGVNYGIGLRYDVTRELGVNLEYTRFGRFAFESFNAFPESDRVRVGVRFRF